VPNEVGREPEPECDRWAGQLLHGWDSADRRGKRRRKAQDEQRRRPLGEDDVLKQMRRQEVVRERVEWRDRGGEEEQAPRGEGGDAPPFELPAANRDGVAKSERQDGERCLEMERPGVRIRAGDGATLGRNTRA
jgi:hypothetical protein